MIPGDVWKSWTDINGLIGENINNQTNTRSVWKYEWSSSSRNGRAFGKISWRTGAGLSFYFKTLKLAKYLFFICCFAFDSMPDLQIGQNFHQGAFFKPHFVSMKEQMFLRCRSIIPAEKARECKLWTLIASRTGLLPPTASSLASYKVMFGSNVQTLNIWQIGTDVQISKKNVKAMFCPNCGRKCGKKNPI